MKQLLSALILVLVIASLTVGGTLATWSDSETSMNNVIATGGLDLKVNDTDDLPWGAGVGTCFEIDDGVVCNCYSCTVPVWNAGSADGIAYLEIKNVVDPDGLAPLMNVEIWYDNSFVTSGWMSVLDGQEILLGDMPADAYRDVMIILHATGGPSDARVDFDIEFDLVSTCAWVDSETSEGNYFQLDVPGLSGTRGFWSQWDSHNTYAKAQIDGWLVTIDANSFWLNDTDSDTDFDTDDMDTIFADGVGTGSTDFTRFLAHYLAQRLDQESGRQNPYTTHNVTAYDPTNYLGLTTPASATGAEIVYAIESKHPDHPAYAPPPPTDGQYMIMKDVCVALNQLDI